MEAPLKVKLNTLNDNLMKFKDLSLGKIADLVDNNEDFIATKFDEQEVKNNETIQRLDKLNVRLKMTDQNLLKSTNTMQDKVGAMIKSARKTQKKENEAAK